MRVRSARAIPRDVTNSSQANGMASGKVMSSATVVTSSVTVTEKVIEPTNTSRARWVSAHHVDDRRHGRKRSSNTRSP